jgi:hypothetical protein
VIALLERGRRSTGTYAKQARIEFLRQLANHAAFPSSVPTFEADDGSDVGGLSGILQLAKAFLKLRHGFLIRRLGETLLEIDFLEQFRKTSE